MRWFWQRRQEDIPVTMSAPANRRVLLGGRRYATDVPYILPMDFGEINRLDFQHYMLHSFLHTNFLAPIGHPRDILDVGSGTGRWAIQMAQQFPQANIFSLDIEAPAARQNALLERQPENCMFVEGDVLKGLAFPNASFDFVHQRLLMGAIPGAAWPTVVRELVRVTRPGGWVELVEASPAPHPHCSNYTVGCGVRPSRGASISPLGNGLATCLAKQAYEIRPIAISPFPLANMVDGWAGWQKRNTMPYFRHSVPFWCLVG